MTTERSVGCPISVERAMLRFLWCNRVVGAFLCALLASTATTAQTATGTSAGGLFYEASGAGESVVLIHAFSVDRRMWAPQIAALEGRFRVIRYDLRGHGNSAAPSAPYAPHEDLRFVLDTLGISRATLARAVREALGAAGIEVGPP